MTNLDDFLLSLADIYGYQATPFLDLSSAISTNKGFFGRIDRTTDDITISINGKTIKRLTQTDGQIQNSDRELLTQAIEFYSEEKIAQLLKYNPDYLYLLPPLPINFDSKRTPSPYYIAAKVYTMSADELEIEGTKRKVSRDFKTNQINKKRLVRRICTEHGVPFPSDLYLKGLKERFSVYVNPVINIFKGKLEEHNLNVLRDRMGYYFDPTPNNSKRLVDKVKHFVDFFDILFKNSGKNGFQLPIGDQLLTFVIQIADRVIGQELSPLEILVVVCPRYGEFDDYSTLEEGLSYTARTYLKSLPFLVRNLKRLGVQLNGHMLVNDSEDEMAGGHLLRRLSLDADSYSEKCNGNVVAINQALLSPENSNLLEVFDVQLLTEAFPEFKIITQITENRLFQLCLTSVDMRLMIGKVADSRYERHKKIMGEPFDFSDSFFLALHYAAEYLAFGYLCRSHPELSNNSFIANYNSPNVYLFNIPSLFAKLIQGEISKEINNIPVLQIKYY